MASAVALAVLRCASPHKPQTEQTRPSEPYWAEIQVPVGLSYDSAWVLTVFTLAKQYELSALDKDAGYIGTGPFGEWGNSEDDVYSRGTTVSVVFAPNRQSLQIRATTALILGPNGRVGRVRSDNKKIADSVRASLARLLGSSDSNAAHPEDVDGP
jgi:hypothetical protein